MSTPEPVDLTGAIIDVPALLTMRPCGRFLVAMRVPNLPDFESRIGSRPDFDIDVPPPPFRLTLDRSFTPGPRLTLHADYPDLTSLLLMVSSPIYAAATALMSVAACQGVVDLDLCIYDVRLPPQHQPPHLLQRVLCLASLRDPDGPFAVRARACDEKHWKLSLEPAPSASGDDAAEPEAGPAPEPAAC